MPRWFDTLKQQKESERQSITAVETIDDIPEAASTDYGWTLALYIKKVTARLGKDGSTCFFLLVKDKAGHCFSIVVWQSQWDELGPFEERETRKLTVKVPRGEYSAWNLM